MNRVLFWFAIVTLSIFAAQVSASTYVGYSGTFGIDNTAGYTTPRPSAASVRSPYTGPGSKLLRGGIHCHEISDHPLTSKMCSSWRPRLSDLQMLSMYWGAGYDFLAVTDHQTLDDCNVLSCESVGWQGWAPHSCEITSGDGHILALGTNATSAEQINNGVASKSTKTDRLAQWISNVKQCAGLAFIAHPDQMPYKLSLAEMSSIYWRGSGSKFDGIAIWNSANPTNRNSESTWDKWIQRNIDSGGVWGEAEDDTHHNGNSRHGAWIGVPGSDGESWGSIKEKIGNGNFYACWIEGGKLVNGESLPVLDVSWSISSAYPKITARLTGLNGRRGHAYFKSKDYYHGGEVDGAGVRECTCTGREQYVRVKAMAELSDGRKLWICSQPLRVYGSGGPTGSAPSGIVRPQSTSPELHLRYLQPEEMPAARPVAGYVGDALNVTTDTGTLPPNATLQLSYDGEDVSAIGGTQYLAIYWFNEQSQQWMKVGGIVDPVTATVEATIPQLGKYCISADLPEDTTAPQVWVDNPPYAASVPVNTAIKATVNDDLGAWRVRFYMNDHLLAEDTDSSDGWGADLTVADYCTGDWTLRAVAEDLAGNIGTAEIPIHIFSTTPPPTVAFVSPVGGALLSGTVAVSGLCSDDVAVASVALYADNTPIGFANIDGSGGWSAEIDTTHLADGTRMLKAIVQDYPGNQAMATVPVGIANGAALNPVGATREAADGADVRFSNAIVVADSSMVMGGFYAEATDRSCGVRVVSGDDIKVGDFISLVGVAQMDAHEKTVVASDILVVSRGNTLPKSIHCYGRFILLSPDSIGKIAKIAGERVATDAATPARWFTIDDGARVPVTCRLADGVTFDTTKTRYMVTGVASVEDVSGTASPVLLVTSSADIMAF